MVHQRARALGRGVRDGGAGAARRRPARGVAAAGTGGKEGKELGLAFMDFGGLLLDF
jgi:hypothetical protein